MTTYDAATAIRTLGATFVRSQAIARHLEELKAHMALPSGWASAMCLGVFGPSGAGKSSLVAKFVEQQREASERHGLTATGYERKRFVSIVMPSSATDKTLASALLTELGDPDPGRGTAWKMFERVTQLLEHREVELIVIDEVQHLIRSGRRLDENARKTADTIKALMSRQICPVVLVGTDTAEELLSRSDQLYRRTSHIIHLEPWPYGRKKEQQEFAYMLSMLQKEVSKHVPFDVDLAEAASDIYASSDGLLGGVSVLLQNAIKEACRRKKPIDRDTLARAHAGRSRLRDGDYNPFVRSAA